MKLRLAYMLCFAGLFVAWMLSVSYVLHLQLPCGGSQDCTAVALSPAARMAGVPIPIFGMAFYLAMAVILGRTTLTAHSNLSGPYFLALGGAAISTGLTLYGAIELHAVCAWCVANNVISCVLALLLGFERRPDERGTPKRLGLFLAAPLVVALLAMGLGAQAVRRSARRFPWNPEALAKTNLAELAPFDSIVVQGEANAPTVVLFMDLQCPACQTEFPAVYAAALKYHLRVAVRNRPHKVHPDAMPMAMMFEQANQQGQGLPFLVDLFNSDFPNAEVAQGVMKKLGVKHEPGLRAESKNRIVRDHALAMRLGLTLTPSIFLVMPGQPPQAALPGTIPTLLGQRSS